jgi:hypothetical protein
MSSTRRHTSLAFDVLETREAPSASPWASESFDSTPVGALPAGWSQWSSDGHADAAVSAAQSLSAPNSLAVTTASSSAASRAWLNQLAPADVQVSAAVAATSLIPAQVLARGSNLGTATPSYYAVAVSRGLDVQLLRVVNGVTTVLADLKSQDYVSGQWLYVTLQTDGSTVSASIYRMDKGEYLTSQGTWLTTPTWGLVVTDNKLTAAGLVGLAHPASYAGGIVFDNFSVGLLDVQQTETFDSTAAGALPGGWAGWSSASAAAFQVESTLALSGGNGLASTGPSNAGARAWLDNVMPADVQTSADVLLSTLIPARVFARGTNLNTTTPSYYAVEVTRGLDVRLVRVVKGVVTVLKDLRSAGYVSGLWVQATLSVQGNTLQAQVYRPDTNQYLDSSGHWSSSPGWTLTATDSTLTAAGQSGVERVASYSGTLTLDNFSVLGATATTTTTQQPLTPQVTITAPGAGATVSGTVAVQATATATAAISKVQFYLDGNPETTSTTAPYQWSFNTTAVANGTHTLLVVATDASGNTGQASETVTVQNTAPPAPTPAGLPNIPQHYSWIRLAELAYSGTPFTSFEDNLLKNSVDLVVSAPQNLATINAVSPSTPQLIYTNLSNLYGGLLDSWLQYADQHGLDRESAFYHVTQATPFSGDSASSQPVNWFWEVARTSGSSSTDLTSQARGTQSGGVALSGTAGDTLTISYPELFRQINVSLASGAGSGWTGALQYVAATDSAGNPTVWKTLPSLNDSTNGLKQSGQINFDPPADWKPSLTAGGQWMYTVRVVTVTGGTAPVANTVLGMDYLNTGGGTSGTVPAFDYAAAGGKDYLTAAEYANRKPGDNAWFAYQGRMPYGDYGQQRYAVNPANPGFQQFAISSLERVLAQNPLAAGFFVDNSGGALPFGTAVPTVESLATDSQDYANMLGVVRGALAPKWLLANTANDDFTGGDLVSQQVQGWYEEFGLRAMASTWSQFGDLAGMVARRAGNSYAILDSLPEGGAPTDPRTQLATLAEYYLLADPKMTFLDFFGGYSPASSWTEHFSQAVTYNVGQPQGSWSVFATGTDPANSALTYKIFQRQYNNALVLYKPLSYSQGVTGTTADNTATTHQLGGQYRELNADGTLGPVVTQITLRNGEGAILIPA